MSMPTRPEVVTLDPASNDDALRLAAAIRSVCDIDGHWDAAEILQALAAPPLPAEPGPWSVRGIRGSDNHEVWIYDPEMFGAAHWRTYNPHTALTWPEVCALGAPEVLEPESVKALREQVGALMYQHGTLVEDIWNESPAHQDATDEEAFRAIIHLSQQYAADAERLAATVGRVVEALDRSRREVGITGPAVDLWWRIARAASHATEDEPTESAPVEVTKEPTDPNVVVRDNAGTAWERRRARTMPEFFYWYDDGRAVMSADLNATVDAILGEFPMSDDGTGHITDCGWDDEEQGGCRCVTLRERVAAHVAAARVGALKEGRRVVASVTVLGGSSLAQGGRFAVQECTEGIDRLIRLHEMEASDG